jgi:hypothetical protein
VPFCTGLLSNVVEAFRRILIDLSECVRVLKRDELHHCVSEYGTAESLAVVQTLSAKPDAFAIRLKDVLCAPGTPVKGVEWNSIQLATPICVNLSTVTS